MNKDNPFNIPDLTPMHNAVWEFIKEHQGEKGFMFLDRPHCDKIYCLVYDYDYYQYYEYQAKAVRAVGDNEIHVLYDPPKVIYTEDDVKDLKDEWRDIQYDGDINYLPLIFELAENITQYA